MTCSSAATAILLSTCVLPFACSGPQPEVRHGPSEPTAQIVTAPTMPTSNDTTTARPIPPIDAAAPAAYRTATFALG